MYMSCVRFILLRNVILQHYYYDVTVKTHLTASNKDELANQSAVYKTFAFLLQLSNAYQ